MAYGAVKPRGSRAYGTQSRIRSTVARAKTARSAALTSRRAVVPGFTRSAGFYGRFAGQNAELKFFDTALSFNFDATGEVPATGQLNLIPQGVTESTRVGRKCVLKSIHLKGSVTFTPAAAATAASTAFMYLVLDKQANGAAAGITDVLTGNGMQIAFNNLSNSQRFMILKKFKWTMVPTAGVTTAYNNTTKHFEKFKKCNIPLEFSSTTGAITELRSNNVFLLAGTDGLSDDTITMNGACRVRFSDGS